MIDVNKYRIHASRKLALEALCWIVLVAIAWWWTLTAIEPDFQPVVAFISILSLMAGIRTFIGHGAGHVTATGIFSLSTSMFVGLSGLLLLSETAPRAGWENITLACVSGLTAQVATSMLAWRYSAFYKSKPFWVDDTVASWFSRVGIIALVLATLFHIAIPSIQAYTADAAFTSICILSTGLLLRENTRSLLWNIVIILGAVILYVELFHAGTGRLHIVALACAVAILASARFPDRRLKAGITLAIPFAIIWMALDRLALERSLGSSPGAGRTGLESMTAPLEIFSLLLRSLRNGEFHPGYGYNLLSVPALIIPDSVWPSQPLALGYELVWFDDPRRYGDGIFSTVATSTGEGIFNFGWLGIPLVILFAAILLRTLDSRIHYQLNFAEKTRLGIMGLILLVMLAGALADYTWSGIHTYSARTISRLPLFLAVLCWAFLIDRLSKRNRQT